MHEQPCPAAGHTLSAVDDFVLSLLEAHCGHIIPALTQAWGPPEQSERYSGTLLFDSRRDRKG